MKKLIPVLLAILLLAGCESDTSKMQRIADLARQGQFEEARQLTAEVFAGNEQMATLAEIRILTAEKNAIKKSLRE